LLDEDTFDGEFVVVFDEFAQKAGEEAERKLLEEREVLDRKLPRLRRVGIEVGGVQVAGQHG